jgi:RNA polymerase sigma-B factor
MMGLAEKRAVAVRDAGAVVLEPSDEELFRRYRRTGDRAVRDLLVERHLAVALWCARRFQAQGERLEDLRQEALIALVCAVDRFDPDYGVAFMTFAVPTIVGTLRRHLRDRVPMLRARRPVHEARPIVHETVAQLHQELRRTPRPDEIADRAGLDLELVLEVIAANTTRRVASLDEIIASGSGRFNGASLCDGTDSTMSVDDRLVLAGALRRLPARERRITILYYLHGHSQTAIARDLGLSQMHISRLLQHSVEHLRILVTGTHTIGPDGPHGRKCYLCRNMTWS